MESFLVLPYGVACASWTAARAWRFGSSKPLVAYTDSAAFLPPTWTATITAYYPAFRLAGPGDQSENQEEEEDDLELESDEDPSKLRMNRQRPGAEDGSPAARGGDGTINPPFP